MNSVFIKVPVSERLPNENEVYFMTNIGRLKFDLHENVFRCPVLEDVFDSVEWWLEEVTLPTEEEIIKESDKGWVRSHFQAGANFILNHIKKGNQK